MDKLLVIVLSAAMTIVGLGEALGKSLNTIGDLRRECASWNKGEAEQFKNVGSLSYCIGILEGVEFGYKLGASFTARKFLGDSALSTHHAPYQMWCSPNGVNNEQRLAVFMRWADNNPSRWNEVYLSGVAAAFSEAWPCKQ